MEQLNDCLQPGCSSQATPYHLTPAATPKEQTKGKIMK
jgi:hypothetical protein